MKIKTLKRLRMVLKQISFSNDFTADALDSMIYMTAPLAKPEPENKVEEKPKPVVQPAEVLVEEQVSMPRDVTRGILRAEKVMPSTEQNRRTIGGLEFVRVPAGSFVMGSKDDNELAGDDEKPQHTVDIAYDYWLARFILTNEQYAEFLGDKRKHPVEDWQKKKDHPVVSISWNDAMAYCKWFNETFKSELGNLLLHLPTEAEWEKAARGTYGNEWPWGNEFDMNKCNSSEGGKGGTTPVGLYSAVGGDSPYGCADMVGNVWEWTHTLWKKYPYNAKDGREDEKSGGSRVLRGGAFDFYGRRVRCVLRYMLYPYHTNSNFGFRVVVSSFF